MHEVVLNDPSLMRQAGRFVWLAVNYDAPASPPIIAKYSAESIPALLVVDPTSDTVTARWVATATAAQVNDFLDRAAKPVPTGAAAGAMAEGERLMGKGHPADAAKAFRRAVDASAAGSTFRASAASSLVLALEESDQSEACARAFIEVGPSLSGDQLASVAFIGSVCYNAGASVPWGATVKPTVERLLEKARPMTNVPLDQRISILVTLASMRDDAGGKALKAEALEILTDAWNRAKHPEEHVAQAAFWPFVAKMAGVPDRAIEPLERCERESPAEYQCTLQLARAYLGVGRLDDAQRASERGRAKAVGAESRFHLAAVEVQVALKRGDKAAARKKLDEAVAAVGSKPSDRVRGSTTALRAQLDKSL
jgi:hypothetical protein